MKQEVLRIRNLNCPYSAGRSLKWINLILFEGECTAFLGLSFSGKDYLLRLLTSRAAVNPGELGISIGTGHISTRKQLDSLVYRMTPDNLSFRDWSCADYIGLGGSGWLLLGRQMRELQKNAENAVKMLGIPLDVRRRIRTLSEKEKRLADLARACTTGARVLVVEDEFEGMTEEEIREYSGILKEAAAKKHLAVILNIHSYAVFRLLSDNYIVFRDGRIVKKGRINDFGSAEQMESYLLGSSFTRRINRESFDAGGRSAAEETDAGYSQRAILYRMRNFALSGFTAQEMKAKFHVVRRGERLDISFREGRVTTLLALDEEFRKRLFLNLSGRSVDTGTYCVIREHRLENGQYPEFVKNRVVSAAHLGSREELFENMSFGENLLLPSFRKITFADYLFHSEHLTSALDRNPIPAEEYPKPVKSGDVNDRIAAVLERWFLYNPDVLVLLEPFEQCDLVGVSVVRSYIRRFSSRGTCVIIIRSRTEYAEDISDEIVRFIR